MHADHYQRDRTPEHDDQKTPKPKQFDPWEEEFKRDYVPHDRYFDFKR
jgi:hypothetical protein